MSVASATVSARHSPCSGTSGRRSPKLFSARSLLRSGTSVFTSNERGLSFSLCTTPRSASDSTGIRRTFDVLFRPCEGVHHRRLTEVLSCQRPANEERVIAGFERDGCGEVCAGRIASQEEPLRKGDIEGRRVLCHLGVMSVSSVRRLWATYPFNSGVAVFEWGRERTLRSASASKEREAGCQ